MKKRLCMGLLACICLLFACPLRALAASEAEFFTDAVFLGDSITVGLEKYVSNKRGAGDSLFANAIFLATNGYMLSHTNDADGYEKHPLYEGERRRPHKVIEALAPSRVFILLGINDAAGEQSTLLGNYAALLERLRAASPKSEIYMLAVFPMTPTKEDGKRSNAKIDAINMGLLKLAMREEVHFVDITPMLKSGNALKQDYSADDYVHISNAGYEVWVTMMYRLATFMQKSGASGGSAKVVNVESYVNARKKASADSALVRKIDKGETVEILEKKGSWYKVAYDSKEMYVAGKYLSVSGSGLSGRVVNVEEYANLRSLPNADAELKARADKDASLTVSQAYYNPSWYRVLQGSSPAYISRDYLKLDK